MTERELLEKILQTVEGHSDDIKDMKTHLNHIGIRLGGVDMRLGGIDTRLGGIDTRLDGIDSRMDGIDSRMDGIDSRMDGMQIQLEENTQIVKALRHNQEYMLAKLHGLETTTAKAAAVEKLQTSVDLLHGKYNVLDRRLFAQEAQMDALLQRAK